MKSLTHRRATTMIFGLYLGFIPLMPAFGGASQQADDSALAALKQSAVDAYVYAYPLVLMDVTKDVATAPSSETGKAPINQFAHLREFPTPEFKDVVTPNADTLYSTAWLDLTNEPIVLSIPNMRDRYYILEILDAWTTVIAAPGSRTLGDFYGDIVIVGPNYQGDLPKGMKVVRSTTEFVWIIGRILTDGPSDFAAVHQLQDQLALTPLGASDSNDNLQSDPPNQSDIDEVTPPSVQVANMSANEFYTRFAKAFDRTTAQQNEQLMTSRLDSLGLERGQGFSFANLDTQVQAALEESTKKGQKLISETAMQLSDKTEGGWDLLYSLGDYGHDYLRRAAVALFGLGANLTADAFYPIALTDEDGQLLNGSNNYVLHFESDQLPPVKAFWSLTLYGLNKGFSKNAIDRYALGDRNDLNYNKDGSLDIYIQHESPGGSLESNWLPAPVDGFYLVLRLYWPSEKVLNRQWLPPGVELREANTN